MTKSQNRKRRAKKRMAENGVNYMKARHSATAPNQTLFHNEHFRELIESLKQNDDFGANRQKEAQTVQSLLTFIEENGIVKPNYLHRNIVAGLSIDWFRSGNRTANLLVCTGSGVRLTVGNGPNKGRSTYQSYGDDLSEIHEALLKHIGKISKWEAKLDNGEIGADMPREVKIVRRLLNFIGEYGIKMPDYMHPSVAGGLSMDWLRADRHTASLVVSARSGLSFHIFDGPRKPSVLISGMDTADLNKAKDTLIKYVGKMKTWEIQLDNIEIGPTTQKANDLARLLLLKADSLRIQTPTITATDDGGIELFWKTESREVGIELQPFGTSVLWSTGYADYFESEPMGTLGDIQNLMIKYTSLL